MKNRCAAAFLVLCVGLPVNADTWPSWRGPTGQDASVEKDGPTYRVAREADVTVVLFAKRKVQATFGFREKELTDEAMSQVLEGASRAGREEAEISASRVASVTSLERRGWPSITRILSAGERR